MSKKSDEFMYVWKNSNFKLSTKAGFLDWKGSKDYMMHQLLGLIHHLFSTQNSFFQIKLMKVSLAHTNEMLISMNC